jgi:hypothetical protein
LPTRKPKPTLPAKVRIKDQRKYLPGGKSCDCS